MGIIIKENSIIFDDTDSMERIKQEQVYLDYIKEHIFLVKKCFVMYMVPLLNKSRISTLISDEALHEAIYELSKIIDTHDASKFSDSEFDGYRAKWYPTQKEKNAGDFYNKMVDDRYEECWIHHYTTNDHHPKHWVNPTTGVSEDMELRAIIEMICDWEAMSLKFNTSTLEWYENKAVDEKKCFSDNTKRLVDELMYNVIHNK